MSASSGASAGCSTGTSRSTCRRAALRRAARPRRRSRACCTSASATSASGRRSPSWATMRASATSRRARVREARRERDRAVRVPATLVRELALAESAGFEAWQIARAEARLLALPPAARAPRLAAPRGGRRGRLRGRRALRRAARPVRARHARGPARAAAARSARRARAVRAGDRRAAAARRRVRAPRVPRRRRSAPSARAWPLRSASTSRPGAWTRRRTRSPSGFAPGDVRLTTREREDDLFAGLFAVLHEAGHGLYEQGLDGRHRGHVLRPAPRRSACTSRSRASGRTWSAARARSGSGIWPRSRQAFPVQLNDIPLDQFVRAANLVEPSLIRVEADEVTYNLHVFLRFELELALVRGDLARGRSARRLERAHAHARRHRAAARRRRRAAGRALVGGPGRLLPDLHARHALLGAVPRGHRARAGPDRRRSSARASTTGCSAGCASTCTAAARSSPPEQIARDATGEALGHAAFMRYLRAKYGELYDLGG